MSSMESKPSQEQIEHAPRDDAVINNDTFAIDETALGNDLPKNYYWSPGFIGTVVALCLGSISQYMGYILPANMLTFINQDIGPSSTIYWVSISYTLGLSVSFLIVGRFSDIFGRRWFFIGGNAMSLIASIIGATATHIEALIGANVLLGLAGAVQLNFTVAVAELVPNKIRPFAISGIFFSSFEIACFGPVIAQGLLTGTAHTWRWAYYLNVIITAVTVLLFYFFYHPPTFELLHMDRSIWEQCKRQDVVGFVLFTGGLILFLMALSWGGAVYAWDSAHVIATLVVGVCALVLFTLYDAYLHKGDPLIPMHLFRKRGYLAIVITAMVGSCVYYSMNVLWPQQIQYLFSGTPIYNGWLACVVGSGALIGQMMAGVLCRYIKRSRWILITGCIILLVFSAAMIDVQAGDRAKGVAFVIIITFAVGVIETVSLTLAPLALPSEDIGAAVGALGSIRSGGAAVATAIYTAILNNKVQSMVVPSVMEAGREAGLSAESVEALGGKVATGEFGEIPGMTPSIQAALLHVRSAAAADAFRYVWYAVIAFAVVAVLVSALTIDYGEYLTDEVARKLQGKTVEGKEKSTESESSA